MVIPSRMTPAIRSCGETRLLSCEYLTKKPIPIRSSTTAQRTSQTVATAYSTATRRGRNSSPTTIQFQILRHASAARRSNSEGTNFGRIFRFEDGAVAVAAAAGGTVEFSGCEMELEGAVGIGMGTGSASNACFGTGSGTRIGFGGACGGVSSGAPDNPPRRSRSSSCSVSFVAAMRQARAAEMTFTSSRMIPMSKLRNKIMMMIPINGLLPSFSLRSYREFMVAISLYHTE